MAKLSFRGCEEEQAVATQCENDYRFKTAFGFHSILAVAKFQVNGHWSKSGADFYAQPDGKVSAGCHMHRHVGKQIRLKLPFIFHMYFSVKSKYMPNISTIKTQQGTSIANLPEQLSFFKSLQNLTLKMCTW